MVRGRRVRAVVACPRNDDCCSPNPKRRGHKITEKNNQITAFFHGVDIHIDTKIKSHNEDDLLITFMEKNDVHIKREVTSTPVKLTTIANPPTPHRIELTEDGCKEPKEEPKQVEKIKTKKTKVTDYFPVRRSIRKTKKCVMEEKQKTLELILRNGIEEGLEIRNFADKGRGVVTSRPFTKGDFVVEYSGDLIDLNEARRREIKYAQDLSTGCYMYYFKHNDQQYCVDATAESGRLGRLVNHSRNGNLLTRTVSVDNKPRLVLIAKDDIKMGEEVMYDYGDRSKESLQYHPWLAY